ncbi:MAG: hypothetical protein J0I06_27230 [Planctomycetes bacterium]|nr:hypothetical protein [Planctomycetota bacterium]
MRLSPRALFCAVVLVSAAPVRAADEDVTTKLPAKCEECQIAGAGRYLVMKLKGVRGLTVYDAATQKLSTIELSDDEFLYAAGGDAAFVYLKESNELQTWRLSTGKMVKAKGFADKPNVQALLMGHSRGDLALLRMGRNPATGTFGSDSLVDTTEIKLATTKYQAPGGAVAGRNWDQAQLRANGDMSRLVEWMPGTGAALTTAAVLSRTDTGYQIASTYNMPNSLIPGDDGRVYTPFGNTVESNPDYNPNFGGIPFKMSPAIKGKALVPAIGGQFVLGVTREGGLTLYAVRSTDAIAPLGDFPGWDPVKPDVRPGASFIGPDNTAIRPEDLGPGAVGEGKNPLTLDRRLCFAPAQDHIVFLPYSNDKVVQRKFDLKATLDAGGEDYLMVVSVPALRGKAGTAWDYQLKTVAKNGPVKYDLPKAPEGMTVSADGKITWTPPKGIIGRAPVEVRGTDAKGKIVRQTFEVTFD